MKRYSSRKERYEKKRKKEAWTICINVERLYCSRPIVLIAGQGAARCLHLHTSGGSVDGRLRWRGRAVLFSICITWRRTNSFVVGLRCRKRMRRTVLIVIVVVCWNGIFHSSIVSIGNSGTVGGCNIGIGKRHARHGGIRFSLLLLL